MENQTVQKIVELADKAGKFLPGSDNLRAPLVSLIVTNFNYARFIEECLESISAQTYPNIECIIVDDVSTDNSVDVIEKFIAADPKASDFRLLKLEQNGGQMNAFIEGFRHANGAFVVFVDADDFLFANFVETHVAAHLNPHHAAALTCSNETIIDAENQVLCYGLESWPSAQTASPISPERNAKGVEISGWTEPAILNGVSPEADNSLTATFVDPKHNPTNQWIWSTTSAIMFRRGVLEAILTDKTKDIRICADFYLLQFAHMIGGSLLINTSLGCYRRHGTNNFALNPTMGSDTRIGSPKAKVVYEDLFLLMQKEVLNDLPKFHEILTEARVFWILANLTPLVKLPLVLKSIGVSRFAAIAQFLGLFAVMRFKQFVLSTKQKLKFA